MALTVIDSGVQIELASTAAQEEQLAALIAPWAGGNVTARVMAGDTLLATLTQGPWVMDSEIPRKVVLGTRQARTFVATGVPTRIVFRAGSTDVFQLTAGVGGGDVAFAASITSPALERLDGLVITAASALPVVPTFAPAADTPYSVTLQDWSTGSAVDVGSIVMRTQIRYDKFEDSALASDCRGWFEHGPASAVGLPELNAVQFSAKLITIRAGGRYAQQSYRVMVMMRALGLRDGLFGDPRGVETYPGAHKLVVKTQAGTVLKTIEMRDGLPMNHSSLAKQPYSWTVADAGTGAPGSFPATVPAAYANTPADKAVRPWVSAGSCYIAAFGSEPTASDAVRNRIPRVDMDVWPTTKIIGTRAIYRGDDWHLLDGNFGGNGNAHPDVTPQWAKSANEVAAITDVAPLDAANFSVRTGSNWVNALRVGWGYEPGALGGITRRGGPGGLRSDRTLLPQELLQIHLSTPTRSTDGADTSAIARGFSFNQANYPGYFPRSMVTLDAINLFDAPPQLPNTSGTRPYPLLHYYGEGLAEVANPNAIWVIDSYGDNPYVISSALEFAAPGVIGGKPHFRGGWSPDSEHNNRTGSAWAALMYADPMFSRMAEQMMMFESHFMYPTVALANFAPFGEADSIFVGGAGSNFWASRSAVLPVATAAMMWWVATEQGVYTRSQIEAKLHGLLAAMKTRIYDALPGVATTPSQRAFAMTGGMLIEWRSWVASGSGIANHESNSGWVALNTIGVAYVPQLLTVLKASGLWDVLRQNATSAYVLDQALKQVEFNARTWTSAPWAMCDTNTQPYIILRRATQGAVEADLTTIPSTAAQVISNYPNPRGDANWFLLAGASVGSTSTPSYNVGGWARSQGAWAYWQHFAPAGAERTAALAQIAAHLAALRDYSPTLNNAGFVRFYSPQSIPALES